MRHRQLKGAWSRYEADTIPYYLLFLFLRGLPWPPGIAQRRFQAVTPRHPGGPGIIAQGRATGNAPMHTQKPRACPSFREGQLRAPVYLRLDIARAGTKSRPRADGLLKTGSSHAQGVRVCESDGELRYNYLGGTQGKGTYQFNDDRRMMHVGVRYGRGRRRTTFGRSLTDGWSGLRVLGL